MNTRPKKHKASADALRRERDELREAVMVLVAECKMAMVCVEQDPLYGWDQPRSLDDYCVEWHELAKKREQTDANRIALTVVEGSERR